jgi:surfeit locus 1 family protein
LLGRWTARDLLLAGTALAVAGGCVRLGVWQLDRLRQRRARNTAVQEARERAPLALPAPGLPPDSMRQRRVSARGAYDYARERLWRPRIYNDAVGASVVTPLRLGDGSAVLVDRGWVPERAGGDLTAYRERDSVVTIEGFAVAAPRGLGDVDPKVLADSVPYPLLPVVVQLLPDGESQARPPLRVPPPALDDGPHLSYAFQWFSFAVIVLVGTAFLLRRDLAAAPG